MEKSDFYYPLLFWFFFLKWLLKFLLERRDYERAWLNTGVGRGGGGCESFSLFPDYFYFVEEHDDKTSPLRRSMTFFHLEMSEMAARLDPTSI